MTNVPPPDEINTAVHDDNGLDANSDTNDPADHSTTEDTTVTGKSSRAMACDRILTSYMG